MDTRRLVCPQLIARDRELQMLVDARRGAAQGHGALVAVEGDAGIGKTRLVRAFRDTLRNGRAFVGTARCREFGNAPYGPVRDALRAAGASADLSSARDRTEQLDALCASLLQLARERLVVLIVEDVHWADGGSLQALTHALPMLASTRALIVVTARTGEPALSSRLRPYIARFAREAAFRRVVLQPLVARDTRRLVLSAAGDGAIDRATLERVVEHAEGNPFFAEELLRDALEADAAGAARVLPATVRGVVEERAQRLDETSRRLVELASVIGRRFDATLLARIAGMDGAAVLRSLRHARDLGLIVETESSGDGFTFRHALTRETIHEGLLSAESRAIHARIVRVLEAEDASSVHDLGYHAWAARIPDACLRYNEAAGDAAVAVHAHAEAVRAFERALVGAADDAAAARLCAKAAESCARDGDARRAAELYEAAAQASERSDGIAAAIEYYELMSREARIGGDNARAMDILQRTLRLARAHDARLHARVALSLAFLYLDRGDVAAADVVLAAADSVRALPGYHNARAYAAIVRGDVAGLREAAARYVDVARAVGPDLVTRARFNHGFGLAVLGCDDEALDVLDTLLPELEAQRLRSGRVLTLANLALVHARGGRIADAEGAVERALAVPEPATTGPIALAAAALTVACAGGDARFVARAVSQPMIEAACASGINSTVGRFAGPYATWLDRNGDADGAASVLRRAMSSIGAPFAAGETLLAAMTLGDGATRRRAESFLPAIDAMARLPIYAATALHVRALAARRDGSGPCRALALAAAERYRELRWPSHEAACRALAGGVERARSARDAQRLSVREFEIAELISRGTSNALLAQTFAVNRRTIEKHLTSIYGKLGVRNRSELAAVVARGEALTERDLSSRPRSSS